MIKKYTESYPAINHEGVWQALWADDKKSIVITAKDGVWLYPEPLTNPLRKERIAYEKDSKYEGNQITDLFPVNFDSEWVIYKAGNFGGHIGLGKINIKTHEIHSFGFISTISSTQIQFSEDGQYMIVADFDSAIRIWDYKNGVLLYETREFSAPISPLYEGVKFLCCGTNVVDEIVEFDILTKKVTPLLSREKILKLAGRGDEWIECEKIWVVGEKVITYHWKEAIRVWNRNMSTVLQEWKMEFLPTELDYKVNLGKYLLILAEGLFIQYDIDTGEKHDLSMEPFRTGHFMKSSEEILSFYNKNGVYFYK